MSLLDSLVQLVNEPEAMRLDSALRAFNPFRVLRAADYELRHSNTLAWLLTPGESHGLRDTFLRTFLAALESEKSNPWLREYVVSDTPVAVKREVKLKHLRQATQADRLGVTETQSADEAAARETGQRALDILLEGDSWLVAIEAKVRSGEGKKQLEDYHKAVSRYARERHIEHVAYIYLTLDGEPPSHNAWRPTSWETLVAEPLEKAIKVHDIGAAGPGYCGYFLDSYVTILRELGDSEGPVNQAVGELVKRYDEQLRVLKTQLGARASRDEGTSALKTLVQRNRLLFDKLLALVGSPVADRADLLRKLLQQAGFEPIGKSPNYIDFVPPSWRNGSPWIFESDSKGLPLVLFQVVNRPDRVGIKMMIRNTGEGYRPGDLHWDKRRSLAKAVHETGKTDLFNNAFYSSGAEKELAPFAGSVYTDGFPVENENTATLSKKFLDLLGNQDKGTGVWTVANELTELLERVA